MTIQEVACGFIPIKYLSDKKWEYLLVQHRKGHWGFPKGRKDHPNETDLDCAMRELTEETGIKKYQLIGDHVLSERYLKTLANGESRLKEVTYFICKVDQDYIELQEDEIQDHAWLDIGEALKKLEFSNTREILNRAHDLIQFEVGGEGVAG